MSIIQSPAKRKPIVDASELGGVRGEAHYSLAAQLAPSRAADQTILDIKDLRIGFTSGPAGSDLRVKDVVKGISFSLRAGETLGIVGESGSGKSVTVRSLLGLTASNQRQSTGGFSLFGDDVADYSEKQWAKVRGTRIGFVLQDALSSLDPLKTIGQEVAEALRPAGRPGRLAKSPEVHALLQAAGIPDPQVRARQYSHELSGGLRQRALIASAVAQNPDLIIADEPTTALDVTVQAQVLDLLRSKVAEGHGLILVSHDLAVVASVCDRILVMKDGVIVEEGRSDQILSDPQEEYTKLLLAAVPSAASRGYRLATVERVPLAARSNELGHDQPVILEATGISKTFVGRHGGVVKAVDDASIALKKGQTLGIVGESGSGKSTLARIVAGIIEPDSGTVNLQGELWSPLPDRVRRSRRHEIQVVAQNPLATFDPRYTVERIIAEPIRQLTKASREDAAKRVAEALDLVQLASQTKELMPWKLSGGQRQRVAIARALATDPSILVADEAVSALDVSIQAQILDLLADIQAEKDVAILFISHDLGVIHHISDSVIVMRHGQILETGSPEHVLVHPQHEYTRELIHSLPALPVPTHTKENS